MSPNPVPLSFPTTHLLGTEYGSHALFLCPYSDPRSDWATEGHIIPNELSCPNE